MRAAFAWPLLTVVGAASTASRTLAQTSAGYRVETYTTDQGLPSQSISGLAETGDGFLWIATGGMLARFDGYEFRSYTQANAPALVRRAVYVDAGLGDTLWVIDEANALLAVARGRVVQIAPPSPVPLGEVTQDGQGNLFATGYRAGWSVWRLGRGGQAHTEVVPRVALKLGRLIRLFRDPSGSVWIVDSVGALRQVGAQQSPDVSALLGLVRSRASGEVFALRDENGARTLMRRDGSTVAAYRSSPDDTVMVLEGARRLWAPNLRGYRIYDAGAPRPAPAFVVAGDASTTSRLLDAGAGCVWVAQTALLKICQLPFTTVSASFEGYKFVGRGPNGAALTWDSAGRVVVMQRNGTTAVVAPARADLRWSRAFLDRRGTIWWSKRSDIARRASTAGPNVRLVPHEDVYAFAQAPRDDRHLWFAAGTGVFRASLPDTGPAVVTDSVETDGHVNAMTFGTDGTLWAAVKDSKRQTRLVRIAQGAVQTLTQRDGLPDAELRALLVDEDGTVWLGTYGGGLARYRNGVFRVVREADGLSENVVTSLIDDDAGNLWMGGNRSVHRVSRRDLDAFLDGSARRVRGVTYGRADGLTTPETMGYPGVRDDSGRFWFPTSAGGGVVEPKHALALDSAPPRIHVLDVRTERDTVDASMPGVRLTRGARRVTVRYVGISPRKSDATRYAYRTDGLDPDWIDAGQSREATYVNVGPGTHVFRVRAINAGGVASAEDATIEFTVPPFFYETPPFYALALAMVGVLALGVVRYRERHLRRREAALTHAVEERTAKLATALDTVRRQADQLRTLDEAKSRFFANVSHEFRTPLSLIVGPVDDLRDGRSGDLSPAVRRRLDGVHDNAERLLQLVEQLLDVARLESGTLHLSAEVRDLVPLLRRMTDSFASLADRRGIRFRLSCPVGGLRVRHDPDQLEKVIGNLVGNALKFTPKDGEVELRASVDMSGDGTAVIEVQDTGPGIAPEFHARIFERFFQVDDSSRRSHEGTGIGLALVRELVELHGGTVEVKSALGAGSTFVVRLPLTTTPGVTSAEQLIVSVPSNGTAARDTPPLTSPHEPKPSDALTVLVVEDNAELLEFLREHLADRYRVLVAENGVRGLEMARAHMPDLIISDVMMPEMDGQSLCEAVKRDAEIDFIPVILLTARASRDSRLAGLAGGADDYLTKPVDFTELLIRADNLIASRRRVRERWRVANQKLPSISVPVQAPPRDASGRALLESLTAVLAAYLADEDFNIDAMASAMGMGRSTLYRKLEPLLGKSPMDALWEYRLAQAAQWLAETSITVSEVAYGVGFKSVPHFCGRFREQYGETPSAYRRARKTAEVSR